MRRMNWKYHVLLLTLLGIGIFIACRGVLGADWLGQKWLTTQADQQWHMNPYIWLKAEDAYNLFAIAFMLFGGISGGIAIATIMCKHVKSTVIAFFATIILTGIAFNTFDWMDSTAIPLQVDVPAWNFWINISTSGWNFYIFFVVVPLWAGAFLASFSATYYALLLFKKK